eukprot:scaffold98764_cov68-Phaeocystis_antarctica.AAC.4
MPEESAEWRVERAARTEQREAVRVASKDASGERVLLVRPGKHVRGVAAQALAWCNRRAHPQAAACLNWPGRRACLFAASAAGTPRRRQSTCPPPVPSRSAAATGGAISQSRSSRSPCTQQTRGVEARSAVLSVSSKAAREAGTAQAGGLQVGRGRPPRYSGTPPFPVTTASSAVTRRRVTAATLPLSHRCAGSGRDVIDRDGHLERAGKSQARGRPARMQLQPWLAPPVRAMSADVPPAADGPALLSPALAGTACSGR